MIKNKFLFSAILVLLFLTTVLTGSAFAKKSKVSELDFRINTVGEDFIDVHWNDIGASYYILSNGKEIVYEGDKTSFLQENLEPGTLIDYNLTAYDKKNTVLDAHSVTTYSIFKEKDVINYTIWKKDSEVILDWSDIPEAKKYVIYLGDELLTETKESEFHHKNLSSGTTFEYKVTAYLPNTETQDEYNEKIINQNTEGKLEEEKDSVDNQYDFITLYLNANTLEDTSGKNKKEINPVTMNALAGTTATTIRIRTFIAEACYGAWIPGSGKGDGRGPSATAGSHRTRVDITTYFDPNTYTSSQNAGESVSYTKNGCAAADLWQRGTATMNAKITHSHKGSYADINVDHSVGAPFFGGILANIDYDMNIKVYEGGAVTLSGKHDGFPDYEVYKSTTSSTSWTRLYYYDASANGRNISNLNGYLEIEM